MHPRIYAERSAIAQERRRDAAKTISDKFGIDPPEFATNRDPQSSALNENEAMAGWMENVAAMEKPEEPGYTVDEVIKQLDGVDGIGPKTIEQVREALLEG